ncbi:transporter substrate-binding domain-containing protein [Oceanicoccus sagamiensis]|uniref:ABC transporter substrate-binding protein n=1 Tax=Oceanicoccus sagamiensis TaxID=716816 RepID=A0A1X9NCT6_9GAMM|nr:transporter substrate-binding domain-containing protein [Oceanicoccus sagamiensis]ARN75848.1 ABC transporter substrate-binding protein [Oceanicoccus sagamiensis]
MFKFLNSFKPLSIAFAGLLALCLSSAAVAGSPTLDRVIKSGVLKAAMSGDQPPFNAVSRDKSVIGFDVDMAQAMAGAMKVKLEIVEMPFGELQAAVKSGKVDMVLSGMAITPERSQAVTFVGPYMMSGKSMLVSAATQAKVKTGADFNKSGITLVALENSTSETFVQRKLPNANYKAISNYEEGLKMIAAGDADAMVADMPACKLAVLRNPGAGLAVLPPLSVEPVGIAIASNDAQFQNLVRNYLNMFEKTGLTAQLRKKWFENDSWIAALP